MVCTKTGDRLVCCPALILEAPLHRANCAQRDTMSSDGNLKLPSCNNIWLALVFFSLCACSLSKQRHCSSYVRAGALRMGP